MALTSSGGSGIPGGAAPGGERPPARVVDLPGLRGRTGVYRDRRHAGEILAGLLGDAGSDSLVLALAAGGIPVAVELAARHSLPVLPAVVSKITLPWNTESGYGAVAFDGSVLLNEPLLATLSLTSREVEEGIAETRRKVERRTERLGGVRPETIPRGGSVLLVDDGLASGVTMLAAARAVRRAGASRVTVAVPTGSVRAVELIAAETDLVICPNIRSGRIFAVADAYLEWHDVGEEEALAALGSRTD